MEHAQAFQAAAPVTIALALAAGMLAQALARHLRLPGIVLLLGAGVLLGPDVAGWVEPGSLGEALHVLVGFAVAVILFEGGMHLDIRRLRREAGVIRRLITIGAVITAVGAMLAARLIMGWDWTLSTAFGSLVIVTGPTVITPLLRRIKVKHGVETVLEAEGVLIDAIGAVLAVVVLQVVVSPSGTAIAGGGIGILARLAFGVVVGVASGFILALLLRIEGLVPEGLDNVFTLAMVLALFQLSNAFLTESGIMTVTAAGMVVGNIRTGVSRELMEFKEQLTVMFIGMLFVLLAADVRVAEVVGLGWRGALTVGALMFLVRPANVLVCTAGSKLTWPERGFVAWLGPRGVIAAAVASLFAQSFSAAGIAGGDALRALVFTVIAGTVLIQGLSGGLVAWALGVRRPAHRGYAVLGAHALGRAVARGLRDGGHEVVLLDNNPSHSQEAEEEGFKVVFGNTFRERTMARARIEDMLACVAITANDEVNLLFARRAAKEYKVRQVHVACRRDHTGVTPKVIHESGGRVMFGRPRDLDLWSVRMRRELAPVEAWRLERAPEPDDAAAAPPDPLATPNGLLLPLVHRRGTNTVPVSDGIAVKPGDVVRFAVFAEQRDEAQQWLREQGWAPEPTDATEPAGGEAVGAVPDPPAPASS